MNLKAKAQALPKLPGVYLFKDQRGVVIYVGKAKVLRQRVASYFKPLEDIKTKILIEKAADLDYVLTDSELKALLLENKLIKKYHPQYNVSLRDDKTYPYLKLTINEPWPRLLMVRKKLPDGAKYFGPFQGAMVREILRLAKKTFPLRWCKKTPLIKRQQPCLYYRLGSCSGPCIGKSNQAEYHRLVAGLILFLKGKTNQALTILNEAMAKAAKGRNYERAAYFRDKIKLLQKMFTQESKSAKLFGQPTERLYALQKELQLKALPLRIEAFDISNISGTNMVGSMVVFQAGLPLKTDYRRFKIASLKDKPNDVAAIFEVVIRRYTRTLAQKLPQPSLILVDGGKGQVNAAAQALAKAKLDFVPVIGLAKKEEIIFFPGPKTELILAKTSQALQLLQQIRDEAHRFAVNFHRHKRQASLFE